MKKLLFLTLISIASNSFCAETKVDDNKEFRISGNMIRGYEEGSFLIRANDEFYRIDNKVAQKLKLNTTYSFVLKKENVATGDMQGIPVQVISYEEWEMGHESSCVIL